MLFVSYMDNGQIIFSKGMIEYDSMLVIWLIGCTIVSASASAMYCYTFRRLGRGLCAALGRRTLVGIFLLMLPAAAAAVAAPVALSAVLAAALLVMRFTRCSYAAALTGMSLTVSADIVISGILLHIIGTYVRPELPGALGIIVEILLFSILRCTALYIFAVASVRDISAAEHSCDKHGLYTAVCFCAAAAAVMAAGFRGYSLPVCISSALCVILIALALYGERQRAQLRRELCQTQLQRDKYGNELSMRISNSDRERRIHHDLRNHISMLSSLAVQKKYDTLERYLGKLMDEIKMQRCYSRSGNRDIDSIINYKLAEGNLDEELADISVLVPPQIAIAPFDLDVLLGSLLDNALQAISEGGGRLSLEMRHNQGILYIKMKTPGGTLKDK